MPLTERIFKRCSWLIRLMRQASFITPRTAFTYNDEVFGAYPSARRAATSATHLLVARHARDLFDIHVFEAQAIGSVLQHVTHGQLAGGRQAREVQAHRVGFWSVGGCSN
jgi:hypothetical protein